MKKRCLVVLFAITLPLFTILSFPNSAFGQEPDTVQVECLENVPANTTVTVDLRLWTAEPLGGWAIPLKFYHPLNTDIVCDSVQWSSTFWSNPPALKTPVINNVEKYVSIFDFYSAGFWPPGDNLFATLWFTTGAAWDTSIGVVIDSFLLFPSSRLELVDTLGGIRTAEFIHGCLGTGAEPENLPPEISVPGTQEVTAGETVEFMVIGTDDDVEDSLTITLLGKGTLTTIKHPSPDTGFFEWVTTDDDSVDSPYTDTFIVSDGMGMSDTDYVQIIVNPFVHNPKITVPGPQTAVAGDTVEFIVLVTDPDPADILTITKDGPGDLQTAPHPTPDTGFYRWETVLDDTLLSPYFVKFYVDDGTGLSDTGEVVISIWPFVPPPTDGDLNRDGIVDVVDVVFLTNYLFQDGPPPNPPPAGDINGDCYITIADVIYLINYVFKMGPAPKMYTEPGDADYDGYVNIPDVIYLINYIALDGPEPPNMKSADVDSSCVVDLVDIVYLVEFLFRGGPTPLCGCMEQEPFSLARITSLRETADTELGNPVYDSKARVMEIPFSARFNIPVAGVQLVIEYDQEKFEPLDPVLTSRTDQLSIFSSHKFGSQIIGLLDLKGENIIEPGEGDLLTLRFKVLSGEADPSGIKVFEAIIVDENALNLEVRIKQNLGVPQLK